METCGFRCSSTSAPATRSFPRRKPWSIQASSIFRALDSAYRPETSIAEKTEAMVRLALANSRMKDFFDIHRLAETRTFDGEMRLAVAATFTRRGRHGELWHLRDSGLVQTVRLDRDQTVVTVTKEGRGLLESRGLDEDSRERQAFHNGVQKPRELKHDAELYRAYMEEAERLRDEGANIHRIVLENDLKTEYQEFLQERNRDRDDSDGRPDRDPMEIQEWAREHELPYDDQGHVQFPDVPASVASASSSPGAFSDGNR